MSEEPKVTMEDCRRAGHCVRGIKRWIEGRGFNFRDFLENGIEESRVAGDGYADHIIKLKREVEDGRRGR